MKEKQRLKLYQEYNNRLKVNSNQLYWKLLANVVRTNFSDRVDYQYLRSLIKDQNFDDLFDYTERLSLQLYEKPWLHYLGAQLHALVKKYPLPLTGVNPKEVAYTKFINNDLRIASITKEKLSTSEFHLHHAAGVCQYVLGVEPDLNAILGACDFGPGASIGVHGNATNTHRKIGAKKWTCTDSCLRYAFSGIMAIPSLAETLFPTREYEDGRRVFSVDTASAWSTFLQKTEIVDYKKISFVPKTSKTHRVIAVEPMLNGFVQKGIDRFMRRELLKIGIFLTDQSTNSKMAREGSLENCSDPYVTIDLSSASDSISAALVERLVPAGWYALLNRTRAKSTMIDGKVVKVNQFVSMGNGFCFPLQSLIFSSLALACGAKKGDFRVYGDDIVVRKSISADLIRLLRDVGFETNVNKTFVSGPFRESCGGDYFSGVDVRPFFLDDSIDSLEKVFKFFNGIQSSDYVRDFFRGVSKKFFGTPDQLLFVRPIAGPDDAAITVEFDEYLGSIHSYGQSAIYGHRWNCLSFRAKPDLFQSPYRSYALAYNALRGGDSKTPFALRYISTPCIRRSH